MTYNSIKKEKWFNCPNCNYLNIDEKFICNTNKNYNLRNFIDDEVNKSSNLKFKCPHCCKSYKYNQLTYLGSSPFVYIDYISLLNGYDYRIILRYYDIHNSTCFLRDYIRDAVTIDSDFGKATYNTPLELFNEINIDTILSVIKKDYPTILLNLVKENGLWFNGQHYCYDDLNKTKEITCSLFGDYRDIRILRKIKGFSIKELSEKIFKTESFLNQIEHGTINLTIENYNLILSALGFSPNISVTFTLKDAQEALDLKPKMYTKNSNIEIAKQLIINHLKQSENDWDLDGIKACSRLIDLINSKNPKIKIKNDEYPVYDGTDCGNYDLVGNEYTLNTVTLSEEIIKDVEYVLDELWSIPTIEGPRLDIFLLL